MAPWNSKPLPSSRSGAPRSGAPLPPAAAPSRAAALLAGIRGSAWSSIVLRAVAVLAGLVVLGWIGRTAAARPTMTMSVAAADPDASPPTGARSPSSPAPAAPTAPAAAPAPAPAPAPSAAPAAAVVSTPDARRPRASTADPVYLNHASIDELRRLPGVGPKRAEAILALRQRVGRFHRVEDLLRVKGIGRSAVKKWRPLVRLDTPEGDAGSP